MSDHAAQATTARLAIILELPAASTRLTRQSSGRKPISPRAGLRPNRAPIDPILSKCWV